MADGGSARDVARRVLRRVERREVFVSTTLDAELRLARLEARDRALATELVYGVLRHRSRLDRALAARTRKPLAKTQPAVLDILRLGAYQLLFLDRVPAHAAVDDAVRAARRVGGGPVGGFVNGVLRGLGRDGEPPLPDPTREPRRYAEEACSLPGWIVGELAAVVPEGELTAAADGLARTPELVVRRNRLRASLADVEARILAEAPRAEVRRAPLCPDALVVSGLGDPDRSPSFGEGLWTVQDLGAQLIGWLAAPEPGQRALDACAGVGGKTTHLLELAGGDLDVEAADLSEHKLGRLQATAARLGLGPVRTRVADLAAEPGEGPVELAVLDAPCSGLGVLRRHPEAKWRVRPEDVARMRATQRALLDAVAARVVPGGVLVYSVCTFTAAEGPEQVAAFLARHPAFAPERPPDGPVPWAELLDARGHLRTWPHRHGADAFFAVRLRRRA